MEIDFRRTERALRDPTHRKRKEEMLMHTTDEARGHCRFVGKGIGKAVEECADLGFAKPADALGFFSNIQQQLYAA